MLRLDLGVSGVRCPRRGLQKERSPLKAKHLLIFMRVAKLRAHRHQSRQLKLRQALEPKVTAATRLVMGRNRSWDM
jgi:hypothetical protein